MQRSRIFIFGFFFTCLAFVYHSCTYEYMADINPVCFERDVLPIFVSNCTQSGCHNSKDRKEGYDLTSYENIMAKGITAGNYKTSKIYNSLVSIGDELMPQSPYLPLSHEQITKIALWIQQGAKKTTCASTDCSTTNITYSQSIKPIFDNYCNGCHAGSNPSGNISYSTHTATLLTVKNGKLMGSIQHSVNYSAMPQNGTKLSDCTISMIQKWIDAGAPNN